MSDRAPVPLQVPALLAGVAEDLAVVVQIVLVFIPGGGFVPGGAKGRYLLVGPVFRLDERRAGVQQPVVPSAVQEPSPLPVDSAQRREPAWSGAAGPDLCQKRAVLVRECDAELCFGLGDLGGCQDRFERRILRRFPATGPTLGFLHCDDAFADCRPVHVRVHGSPIDGEHGH
jgi:hypothetical protein